MDQSGSLLLATDDVGCIAQHHSRGEEDISDSYVFPQYSETSDFMEMVDQTCQQAREHNSVSSTWHRSMIPHEPMEPQEEEM